MVLSMAVGYGILPSIIEPSMIIGFGIISWTVLTCCMAVSYIGAFSSRIPEYGEMEILFKEGKDHYEDGEWREALKIF